MNEIINLYQAVSQNIIKISEDNLTDDSLLKTVDFGGHATSFWFH